MNIYTAYTDSLRERKQEQGHAVACRAIPPRRERRGFLRKLMTLTQTASNTLLEGGEVSRFIRASDLTKIDNIDSFPQELHPYDRVLLFNDGSQTSILEALCGRQITVKKRWERITIGRMPILGLKGEKFYVRDVTLHDGRTGMLLVHAISFFDCTVLGTRALDEMKSTVRPIGRILNDELGQLRRELVGYCFEPSGASDAVGGDPLHASKNLRRVYRLWHERGAVAFIVERFPLGIMKLLEQSVVERAA
jgi:chorismate-pyruvate lyase